MTPNEYQEACAVTINPELNRDQRFGNWFAGFAGEMSELLAISEQVGDGQADIADKKPFIKELGDCAWYGAVMARELGIKLRDVLEQDALVDFQEYAEAEQSLEPLRDPRPTTAQWAKILGIRVSKTGGAFCDFLKKVLYHNHADDRVKITNMLEEYFQAIAVFSILIGSSLQEVADTNIAKLRARYTDGKFSTAESVNRKAGDV